MTDSLNIRHIAVTFKLIEKKFNVKVKYLEWQGTAQYNFHQIALFHFLLKNLSAQVDLRALLNLNSNEVQDPKLKNEVLGLWTHDMFLYLKMIIQITLSRTITGLCIWCQSNFTWIVFDPFTKIQIEEESVSFAKYGHTLVPLTLTMNTDITLSWKDLHIKWMLIESYIYICSLIQMYVHIVVKSISEGDRKKLQVLLVVYIF